MIKNILLNKNIFIYILIFLCQIVGIVFKQEFIAVCLIAILSILLILISRKDDDANIAKFIVFLLAFQNFFIGFTAHLANNTNSSLSVITQVPTIIVYLYAFSILIKKKLDKLDLFFFILCAMLVISALINISSGKLVGKLNYIRNYTVFYCFFLMGRHFLDKLANLKSLMSFTEKIAIFMSIIGIIFIVCPFSLFKALGINELYIAKGAPLTGDYMGRFTTTIYKNSIKRIGSLMFEPINFGYFLIVPLITLMFKCRKRDFISLLKFVIVLLAFLTSFSKGAYLIFFATVGMYIFFKVISHIVISEDKPVNIYSKGRSIFTMAILTVGIAVCSLAYYKLVGAAANTHFWAIERTFVNTLHRPLFGYGIGTGGNYGSQNSGWLESGGESGLMGLIYQMGYIFAFITFLLYSKISYQNFKNKHNFMLAILPFVFFVMSIFQENTFSPQCLGILFLVSGALYSMGDLQDKEMSL